MDYLPLDESRNEIRLLGFIDSDDAKVGPPRCTLQQVSLDLVTFEFQQWYEDTVRGKTLKPSFSEALASDKSWEDAFSQCVDDRLAILQGEKSSRVTIPRTRFTWGDYEALSYVWGEPDQNGLVFVDGEVIRITRRLEEALRALRRLPESKLGMLYWVDAICINQVNLPERNRQVKRMGEIFSKARSTVSVVGEEFDRCAAAIDLAYKMNYTLLCRHIDPTYDAWDEMRWCEEVPFGAFEPLLIQDYWERAWIVQEVANNQNSGLFIYGSKMLPRKLLELVSIFFRHHPVSTSKMRARAEAVANLLLDLTGPPSENWHKHLTILAHAKSTDPRDNIYGFLGLLKPEIAEKIRPDYSLPIRQIFTDFATAILTAERGLDLLLLWSPGCDDTAWPSWVPNWQIPFRSSWDMFLHPGPKSISDVSGVNSRSIFELSLLGYILGEIRFSYAPSAHVVSESPSEDQIENVRYTGVDSHTVEEALERTLTLDSKSRCGGHTNYYNKEPAGVLNVPWGFVPPEPADPFWREMPNYWTNAEDREDVYVSGSSCRQFNDFRNAHRDQWIFGRRLMSYFAPAEQSKDWLQTWYSPVDPVELKSTVNNVEGRRLVLTDSGYLGLAPEAAQNGDRVALLMGCSYPVVLRSEGTKYRLVGECYLHGLMSWNEPKVDIAASGGHCLQGIDIV